MTAAYVFDDVGTLVLEERFAIVPEWIIDADISDCASSLYSVQLDTANLRSANAGPSTTRPAASQDVDRHRRPRAQGTTPQQRPQRPTLRRRDAGLGQQVGAEQLGEDRRVDRVVLQPGPGDRLALQGCARCGSKP
jgi:hypothetical protein